MIMAFVLSQALFAQISITSNGLLTWENRAQIYRVDTTRTVQVDVGTAGGNQTWDFTNLPDSGPTLAQELTRSANTPFASIKPVKKRIEYTISQSSESITGFFFLVYSRRFFIISY
ncbi:hypothetical protein GF407_10810 [candidate division KSB1 bacterium]|nr:hypothetical protein [candidate division KSB1 bacterium]